MPAKVHDENPFAAQYEWSGFIGNAAQKYEIDQLDGGNALSQRAHLCPIVELHVYFKHLYIDLTSGLG